MNIKGYVDISLYNVETGELEHEEKTWHNAVLNSNLFMQSPFYWNSRGALQNTSKKFVYNIVCVILISQVLIKPLLPTLVGGILR